MKYFLASEKSYSLVTVKNVEKSKRNTSHLYILIKEDTCSFDQLIFVSIDLQRGLPHCKVKDLCCYGKFGVSG